MDKDEPMGVKALRMSDAMWSRLMALKKASRSTHWDDFFEIVTSHPVAKEIIELAKARMKVPP